MTIKAKFRGTCRICSGVIQQGDSIEWTRGSRIVTHTECSHGVARANGADPVEDDDYAGRSRYDGSSRVSNVTTFSSGATIYTNRRGRCEDAPCCGCCS